MPTRGARSVERADDQPSACVGGVVVCGGRSRRMGEDKADLEFNGRSLLQGAVDLLTSVCDSVVLACGPRERYREFGLPLALDASSDSGPVAGLIAGLEAAQASHAVVIACDMPFLSKTILEALVARTRAEELDACFLTSARGIEPLCAIYGRSCLPALRSALAAGQRKVTAFLEEPHRGAGDTAERRGLKTGRVHLDELDETRGVKCLSNLNTPEDLERAHRSGAREQRP